MAATRNGTSDGIGEQNATDMEAIVISKLGEKQKDLFTVVLLTIVYVIIFLTGSVGNLTTCLILRKRVYLHTVTNIYLLNLAIADLLTIVLGFNAGVMVLIQFGNNLTDISNYSTNLAVQSGDQGGYNGSWLNDSESFDSKSFVIAYLGKQQGDTSLVVALTIVYMVVYLSGVLGNSLTFLVIYKNAYMRTVTNCYLMSLALSDLLTISVALPPEVYTIWEAYPWRFGEPFCIFKAFLLEWTSYASVLTITGFTVERYIAICHPITGQKVTRQSRAFKCIICIWIISACCALPYPFHTRTFYYLNDPRTNLPITDTLLCNIPVKWHKRMIVMFQVSTFAFFFLPMTVITIMYILIGIRLRRTEVDTSMGIQYKGALSTTARARKAVLKMLVAVVVAFFLCWAPFHAQRLMTLYVKDWSPESMEFHSHLFYISGVLYFVSSTVNPILYNLLSRKFRYAFKRTFCRCCLNLEPFPTFYKLKAIFINRSDQNTGSPSPRFIYPQKPVGMDTFFNKHGGSLSANSRPVKQASTKDTVVKCSSSSSSSHAHSDGRLHFICRHKSCSSNRIRLSLEINSVYKQFNNASCQDIETLRKMKCFKQLSKFDSKEGDTEKEYDVTASLI